MCCRTSIRPIVPDLARDILRIGKFEPQPYAMNKPIEQCNSWMRYIPEEFVTVNAAIDGESLTLSLSPAVSVYAHHHGKRRAAAVMLEIAAKYAEKVDGEIIQHANVVGCTTAGEPNQRLLGSYPSRPLQFEQVCNGFKAEFLTPIEEVGG